MVKMGTLELFKIGTVILLFLYLLQYGTEKMDGWGKEFDGRADAIK